MRYILKLTAVPLIAFAFSVNCQLRGAENPVVLNDLSAEKLGDPNDLSIKQSLLPVFSERYYTNKNFAYNRINPNVREYLRFYLENDNSITQLSGKSIELLGYVGKNDDIPFVGSFIEIFITQSTEERLFDINSIANGAGCFSGMMIKRKIKGAESFFKEHADVSAWVSPEEEDLSVIESARYAYSIFMIKAYQFSKEDYVLEYLQTKSTTGRPYRHESELDNLGKLKIDLYTRNTKPNKMSKKELDKTLNKHLDEIGGVEAIMNKKTDAQWRKLQSINKQKDLPKVNILSGMNDDPLVRLALAEAFEAYITVTSLLLEGNFEDMGKLLADNGKAIPPGKIKKKKGKMIKALEQQKQLFEEVRQAGLNDYNDIRVKVTLKNYQDVPGETIMEAKFDGFPSELQEIAVDDKEKPAGAVITFVIRNTADIYKNHIPAVFDNSTRADNGDIKVFMIQINGKWLWNPFGW